MILYNYFKIIIMEIKNNKINIFINKLGFLHGTTNIEVYTHDTVLDLYNQVRKKLEIFDNEYLMLIYKVKPLDIPTQKLVDLGIDEDTTIFFTTLCNVKFKIP